ncbi:hypothetical protein EYR36_006996 [Pleurotus pulmonarius]|nr:hypothetical protein EYR36_006996 [Pleurotus pulmonarius]
MPVEIVDQIIASFNDTEVDETKYQEDVFPTLKACSLVCWTWNELCRPHIFSSLSVDLCRSSIDTAFIRLSFLHFTAPRLYKCITNFRFRWNRDIPDPPQWIPDALTQFTNLRSLSLYSGVTSGFPPLSAPFALAITTLVARTPLTKLHLAYWDFLYDVSDLCLVLSSCSSTLVELTLEECYISDRGMMVNPIEDGVLPVVHLGALRKLALVNNGNVSLSQLRHIDAPNLRSLSCAFLKDPFQDISPWIPATVTEFTLDVRDFSERPWFGKSIRPSWLTIIFRLSYHDEPQCFPVLSWIEDCLNQLPFPHVLHRLDIKVLNLLAFSYPFNYPRRAHYEVLHRALQRFHALDRTNLDLHFLFYSVLPPPYDRRDLKAVFGPQLEANKLVVDMTFQKWSNE